MKLAITVSLVPEAKGGPFVFWDGLEDACREASRIGFEGIEIFAPDAETIRQLPIQSMLDQFSLRVAAFGTGAGMVKHGLSLGHPDGEHRRRARQFVRNIIEAGAVWQAPAIIGSMQGRWSAECDRPRSLSNLRDSLNELGKVAYDLGVDLLYEPLNRYETNMINTLADGVALMESLDVKNIKLLADLFHMNIEESDIAASLSSAMPHLGHIHFVDSNRRAAGFGHMTYQPIADAIRSGGYDRYLSAEIMPLPDSITAAEQTMQTYRQFFGPSC